LEDVASPTLEVLVEGALFHYLSIEMGKIVGKSKAIHLSNIVFLSIFFDTQGDDLQLVYAVSGMKP
jgi:hypothetical protein